jgi:2-amino-4-hydroxy-6-hydroxymethyldihydropteridine diphosphokinase
MSGWVWLGLGSNVGERLGNLAAAIEGLEREGVRVLRVSGVYETAPRDFLDQPAFLNCVAEAEAAMGPEAMLRAALQVEKAMGRVRDVAKGPRVIDIDILFYRDQVVRGEGLEIPHPRIAERRFVLEPLAELAPELVHPVLGRTVAELLEGVRDQEAARVQTGIPTRQRP